MLGVKGIAYRCMIIWFCILALCDAGAEGEKENIHEKESILEHDRVSLSSEVSQCSWSSVRSMRQLLSEFFFPIIEVKEYDIPDKCILSPNRDMLIKLDHNEIEVQGGRYACGFCTRQFESHIHLDRHMKASHSNEIDSTSDVCLDDYANIFGRAEQIREWRDHPSCRIEDMERRRLKCLFVLSECFPPTTGETSRSLFEYFSREFCIPLHCSSENIDVEIGKGESEQTSKRWTALKIILTLLLLFFLAVFYCAVWLYRRESTLNNDLHRLSLKRQTWKFGKLFKPKKLKGY